jgi:hypothetical protein
MDIIALNRFGESSRSQILHDLVTASNDRVDYYWEVFRLFEACLLSVKDYSQVIAIVDHAVKLSWVKLVV